LRLFEKDESGRAGALPEIAPIPARPNRAEAKPRHCKLKSFLLILLLYTRSGQKERDFLWRKCAPYPRQCLVSWNRLHFSTADIIATANPGCMLQLQAGVRLHGSGQRVMHVVEVLDLAYKNAK